MEAPSHNPDHAPQRIPSKRERVRKIKAIRADIDLKRRELGMQAPSMKKGPVFYLGLMAVLAILGLSVIKATESGNEALGRFKFHCGEYPTTEEGLEALASKDVNRDGWVGPYIKKIVPDPWKNAYIYEFTNGTAVVLSMGPDGVRGTADDIAPASELFAKPFHDTTWTNNWAPYWKRGYIIVPSKSEK